MSEVERLLIGMLRHEGRGPEDVAWISERPVLDVCAVPPDPRARERLEAMVELRA